MMKYRARLLAAVGAVATAGVVATTGVLAAAAAPHPARADVSGTENFQAMTTSDNGPVSVIASGVFTAPGTDTENQKAGTSLFTFPKGTVSLKHSPGKGTQTVNPKTCLVTINFHGTYTITGGTGEYSGISGSGTYKLNILGIAARVSGKCDPNKAPVAIHQVINATGTASL